MYQDKDRFEEREGSAMQVSCGPVYGTWIHENLGKGNKQRKMSRNKSTGHLDQFEFYDGEMMRYFLGREKRKIAARLRGEKLEKSQEKEDGNGAKNLQFIPCFSSILFGVSLRKKKSRGKKHRLRIYFMSKLIFAL